MGGSTNSSLTGNDQSNLNTFLDNGGKLWLIGQNILESVPSWFVNKVGLSSVGSTLSLPSNLVGTNPGTGWIDTAGFNPQMTSKPPFTIARQLNLGASAKAVFYDASSRVLASQCMAGSYKTVVFAFEFARVNDTGDQAVIAYKVINWLAGIPLRTGVDVAVAGQTIDPLTPRYNQPVNITAIIRNNGNVDLKGVRTRLYINDQPKTLLDNVTDLAGNGSWKSIKFQWVPDRVGSYIVKVMVDPDNEIEETNEANNVYVSDVAVFKIEVIYTVLLVDDDSSPENGGGGVNPDVATHVLNALTTLGYTVGKDLDVQRVPRGQDRDNNAYNASNYSCIIWVTGMCTAGGGYNTLTNNDMNIIQNYLSAGLDQVSFLLIGRNILADSVVQNRPDFYQNILGASNTGSVVTRAGVYGVLDNPVTNGMYFKFDNGSIGSYNLRSYTKIASAIPLFWADGTSYWERTSDAVVGTGVNSSSGWHSAYLGFDLAYTNNTSLVAEFLYGIIHWFGRLDNRPELRVTPPDIFAGTNTKQYIILPNLNPQLGESYVLKANITNWGGQDADVIVRFLDGDTVIGSQNVHVPASYRDAFGQTQNGKITAEVIWTPLFAGLEPIRANIDPDGLLVSVEVLRQNNLAEQKIEVYYFYDDMEDQTKALMNWKHYATLLRINGESPLEYMDPAGSVDVNIVRNWEEMRGFNRTNKSAHSYPSSFYMTEATGGGRLPMSVCIVIDASGSMSWDDGTGTSKWTRTRDALFAFLDKLNTTLGDEACLIIFSGSGGSNLVNLRTNTYTNPHWAAYYTGGYTYYRVVVMHRFTQNINAIKTAFNSVSPTGGTPLGDGVGFGARWLVDNEYVGGQRVGYNRTHYPALIVLTDGASNVNDPYGDSPWYEPNTNRYAINDIRGVSWTDFHGNTIPALRFDGGKTLNSTVPVFMIGLGSDAVDWWGQGVADASLQILKRGPFSSGGHTWRDQYFYAPTGNDLQAIFDAIFKALEDWGGGYTAPPQAPSGADGMQPRAITLTRPINTNGCNYTLTPAITLSSDMENVTLSFYHRYSLLGGKNGGVVLVGTSDGGFNNFKYIIPTKNYPSNIMSGMYVDAYGTPITFAYSTVSAGGTAGWEYAEFDLTPFIPASGTRQIKIAFQYLAKSENTGNGGFWYIDDVEVRATRKHSASAANVPDQWQYIWDANRAHRGYGVWWNGNPSTGYFSGGIDNS
ncbi:MAG: CARDB domain-containing protein, partial [Thermoplasmata archaeon]